MRFKAQASLDYLMTYAWAILIVILVAAALFTLGIFNVNHMMGNKAVGFTGVQVSAFRLLTNGQLYMKFTNEVGVPIGVRYVNATWVDKGNVRLDRTLLVNASNGTGTINTTIGVGKVSSEIDVGNFNTSAAASGDTFTMEVVIGYRDFRYNTDYVQFGVINGIIE